MTSTTRVVHLRRVARTREVEVPVARYARPSAAPATPLREGFEILDRGFNHEDIYSTPRTPAQWSTCEWEYTTPTTGRLPSFSLINSSAARAMSTIQAIMGRP